MSKRRPITERTIKRLFAASGGSCAFPACPIRFVEPGSGALLAQLCHINAVSRKGPRFDPHKPPKTLNDFDNLILLCPTHHTLVDQEFSKYTVASLKRMKLDHESRVTELLGAVPTLNQRQTLDLTRQLDDESVDFAVVVAHDFEMAALRHYFPELQPPVPEMKYDRPYYQGTVKTTGGGAYRVVATSLDSMGNLEAAHITSTLIRDWKPRFVLINGVAGGISRGTQDLGDIVVSDSVVYYELGKIQSDGLKLSGRQFPSDPSLLDGMRRMSRSSWWRAPASPAVGSGGQLREPKIHIGPIASGEKIIASAKALEEIQDIQRNLIAVEMESAGVASAAFSAVKKVGVLTIRSISDFADGSKQDNVMEYAANSAAWFLRNYIESRPVPVSEGQWPSSGSPSPSTNEQGSIERRKRLFSRLCDAFDNEEFKNLCFLLGIDVDELPGDRKSARARELILLFERKKKIYLLEEAVFDDATWLRV